MARIVWWGLFEGERGPIYIQKKKNKISIIRNKAVAGFII